MPLMPGQVLQSRYRIVSWLKTGGMGSIYRAWHLNLKTQVAIKEMTLQSSLDPMMQARLRQQFEQEASILARLRHRHLVSVIDYFAEQGNVYLVMEFVEGQSLEDRIKQHNRLSETEVLDYAYQLLDALAYCHSQHIVHRDIKPQNIMLRSTGVADVVEAVLVDFGLVKLWDPHNPQTEVAIRGAGTPGYAPPEQYGGLGQHTGPFSDLYSLGATLYHALSGQSPPTVPERASDFGALQPLTALRGDVSVRTANVIEHAMALAPEQRFRTAEEMRRALTAEQLRQPSGGKTLISSGPRLWRWGAGTLAMVAMLGLVAGRLIDVGREGGMSGSPTVVASNWVTPDPPGLSAPDPSPSPLPKQPPAAIPQPDPTLAQSDRYVLYILDASNGMLSRWDRGESKLISAKKALAEHWLAVGSTTHISLRAYGHRRDVWDDATCQDTELLVPMGLGQIDDLAEQLQGAQAQGMDGLAEALRQALGDFPQSSLVRRTAAVVLVTDGWEADNRCGDLGSVTALVRNQRDTGLQLPIYIVGLDVPPDQMLEFRSIAAITGGEVYGVDSVQSLSQALNSAIEAAHAGRE
jgi:eukaryotic-like serine/threonine-protein kinase